MPRPMLAAFTGLLVAVCTPAYASVITIQSTDAIWNYAGSTSLPIAGAGSTVPTVTSFSPGAGQILTFSSVTGAASLTPGYNYGPDGGVSCPPGTCPLAISGTAGLSGIVSGHSAFLAGVFLNGSEATMGHIAPPTLTFLSFAFSSLTPLDDQVFFIGDGLTGTGSGAQQTFNVPADATSLVLGITDADGYSGPPGAYFDNSGSFAASFAITGSAGPVNVPEPASLGLVAIGVCCASYMARRRRLRGPPLPGL